MIPHWYSISSHCPNINAPYARSLHLTGSIRTVSRDYPPVALPAAVTGAKRSIAGISAGIDPGRTAARRWGGKQVLPSPPLKIASTTPNTSAESPLAQGKGHDRRKVDTKDADETGEARSPASPDSPVQRLSSPTATPRAQTGESNRSDGSSGATAWLTPAKGRTPEPEVRPLSRPVTEVRWSVSGKQRTDKGAIRAATR